MGQVAVTIHEDFDIRDFEASLALASRASLHSFEKTPVLGRDAHNPSIHLRIPDFGSDR